VETLSEFFASAVEFLVGGVLFLLSLVFLLSVGVTVPKLTKDEMDLLSANATLIATVFLSAAYAMGVVAESLARSPFEFLLDRVTVRTKVFLPLGDRTPPSEPDGAPTSAPSRWRALQNWFIVAGLGDNFTIDQRNLARDERERQRTAVMTDESLHAEVQGQLKRLRLERVTTLCLAVTAFSFVIRGHWHYSEVAGAATICMGWVVKGRFRRFVGTIVRTYKLVDGEDPRHRGQRLNAGPRRANPPT
jgi:hypothetical protein